MMTMCRVMMTRVFVFLVFFTLLCVVSSVQGQDQQGLSDKVLVVTNREIDTLPGGGLIFTNQVDTTQGLKYLWVFYENGEMFARSFPDLVSLLVNPVAYSHWAVWVHGDGQKFALSMDRAMEIQALHQVNFIVFSWPTNAPDKGPIGNFKNSLKNIPLSTRHLAELFNALQAYKSIPGNRIGEENLSIFFHSLGCRLLQQTIEDGLLDGVSPGLFDNLVINAAATDDKGHSDWIEKLSIQERLYITNNDADINLEGLRVLSSLGMQLGERPGPPRATNAVYLDFTGSVGFRFPTGATHSYYYATITRLSKNIRQVYTDLFQGKELNLYEAERFEAIGEGIFGVKF